MTGLKDVTYEELIELAGEDLLSEKDWKTIFQSLQMIKKMKVEEYHGDEGLLGYSLSSTVLFNRENIEDVNQLLTDKIAERSSTNV